MSYLNRFSKDTQDIVKKARMIAEDNRQPFISTTHFLMGILVHRDNMACRVLEELDFDINEFYHQLKAILVPHDVPASNDALIFTPDIKTVFEIAETEMNKTGSDSICSIHLLLSLLKTQTGETNAIFDECELTYEEVYDQYLDIFESENFSTVGANTKGGYDEMGRTKSSQERSKTEALDTFGRNLTRLAREKKLDPVIGRDTEIKRCWRILARRKKNNAILIGNSGVGKSAIAEGLANAIAAKEVPSKLADKQIYLLDVNGMVAGSKFRGDFEKKMEAVIKECTDNKNIILFIDEIHTIIGAGGAEGSMDGANILKPALASGDLQVIGATTTEEYQKYFEKDGALVRRFQKINVLPPNKEDTLKILIGLKAHYEKFHSVKYSDDILKLIVDLSDRYIPTQYEPDRSINTLDEVGSKLSLIEDEANKEISDLRHKVAEVQHKMEDAVLTQDYKLAAGLKEKREILEEQLNEVITKNKDFFIKNVTEEDVREVFSLLSGVPVESVQSNSMDAKRYLNMASELNKEVINQEEAIETLSKVIKRKKAGIDDQNKPAVIMLAGATGTGKTFTSKCLAKFLFGDTSKLIFMNGAEYADRTATNRLTSSNPGYVGYGEATDFEAIRNNPYSILLVDECEKMHVDIWKIFLRIFEEGELKTSNGKLINFKNTIIILTSNLGSEISKRSIMGFDLGKAANETIERKKKYEHAIKDYFKPEVYNRISKIVVFNDLRKEDLLNIVDLELEPLKRKLKEKNITLKVNKKVNEFLVSNSDDKNGNLGARPIKRSIDNHLNDVIADIVLEKGDSVKTISVNVIGEQLKITSSVK